MHAVALDPHPRERVGDVLGPAVTGVVRVVRDQHALGPVQPERRPVRLGEAAHAVARDHVGQARGPKRHRVEECLAQDDLLRRRQRFAVPDRGVRPRKIQVRGCALAELGPDLPRVGLRELPALAKDRDHDAPAKMLMPTRAEEAEPLQSPAERRTRLPSRARQPIGERAIRVA